MKLSANQQCNIKNLDQNGDGIINNKYSQLHNLKPDMVRILITRKYGGI